MNINIGIIGATSKEIKIFKQLMYHKEIKNVGKFKIYIGTFHNNNIFLIKSGIGKVSASIACTLLISLFAPHIIVNSGTAGSLNKKLKIGDIIIPNKLCYYDVDLKNFGYAQGQVPKYPKKFEIRKEFYDIIIQIAIEFQFSFYKGLLITGDSFIRDKNLVSQIKYQFSSAVAVEMEATAIAQVCYQFDIPLIVIKSISDLSNIQATLSFQKNIFVASLQATNLVKLILENQKFINLSNK